MTTRSRRSPSIRAAIALTAVLSASLAACDTGGGGSAVPTDPAVPSAAATTSPGSSAPVEPGPSEAPLSQTDTDWGRIWDALPQGFPRFPGATTADDMSPEPVSATYVIAATDPASVVDWLQTALETATYSTEALSGPLEDGSYVLDSVGEADCRIETRVASLDEMTLVTVRYGAACPA